MSALPRYPVYVPTKGRSKPSQALTIRFLQRDGVPFRVVLEPGQLSAYEGLVPPEQMLVLPQDGMRLLGTRNWIMDHAISEGHARHWQLDDNMRNVWRVVRGKRLYCASGPALAAMEDFSDRYENVAISGPNYYMFGTAGKSPPFRVNCHVYSCTLINNSIPQRWRLVYNDDTDLCLQVLAAGLCTVQFNAFLVQKVTTMKIDGGNTTDLYQGDGRLHMARALERQWPGVVRVDRRWGRPQHVINWSRFRTPLVPVPGLDLDALKPNEYGMRIVENQPVKSAALRRWVDADKA